MHYTSIFNAEFTEELKILFAVFIGSNNVLNVEPLPAVKLSMAQFKTKL
jgi:hypothetical protein